MPKSKEILHPSDDQVLKLNEIATKLRESVVDMLVEAGSGHSAGPLGTADIFATLYFHLLDIDPKNPNDPDRDRFVLSNGHICPILYATLAHKGFFPVKELWTLRKFNTRLHGHPDKNALPGVEVSAGPLGQGLSQAIGMAIAGKMDKKDHLVVCMTSDGELNEGQTWEAAMFAGNHRLDNLIWIIDRNNIQIDGYTEDVQPLEDLKQKLEAFNWYTIEIDGHNITEIVNAFKMAQTISLRPIVIIAHTVPGEGVNFMEYKFEWHGKPPNSKEAQKALRQLRSLEGKIISEYE